MEIPIINTLIVDTPDSADRAFTFGSLLLIILGIVAVLTIAIVAVKYLRTKHPKAQDTTSRTEEEPHISQKG